MKLINYITDSTLGYETLTVKLDGWNVRQAVRAVLVNKKNETALMHIGKYDVYKLPGGGVDENEDLDTAFVREMLEETGCEVKKVTTLGVTIEKRDQWKMFQVSHCYLAKSTKVQSLKLTEGEKEESFTLCWVKDVDEAIKLVSANKSSLYDNKYIKARGLSILQRAKETCFDKIEK